MQGREVTALLLCGSFGPTAADGSQKQQVTNILNLKEFIEGPLNQLCWTNFMLQGTMQCENISVCPFCTILLPLRILNYLG